MLCRFYRNYSKVRDRSKMTKITVKPMFCKGPAGEDLPMYTFSNSKGMEIDVIPYGGDIVSIRVPDRDGNMGDVLLGYDGENYVNNARYRGQLIGRCGNRIGRGKFTLNGKSYQLNCNDGRNHLHGGNVGFNKKVWDCQIESAPQGDFLTLKYHSPDGEEFYPGNMDVTVTYSLTDKNEIVIRYQAVSDKDTLCNLTNHAYFNLRGHDTGDILDHEVKIYADYFTEADEESIPTGRVLAVDGTPMDFKQFHKVGERIDAQYTPVIYGKGYDHNWVLNKGDKVMGPCAEVYCEATGRLMRCFTTSPCVQFYTANFINGSTIGKGGYRYQKRAGLCLETQFAPDAANHPDWASPILRAGDLWDYTTIYEFSVKE